MKILKDLRRQLREMGSRQKQDEHIPPYTCPMIDDVREAMIGVIAILGVVEQQNRPRSEVGKGARKAKKSLSKALMTMEKIRTANSNLRDASYGWHDVYRSIRREMDLLIGDQGGAE